MATRLQPVPAAARVAAPTSRMWGGVVRGGESLALPCDADGHIVLTGATLAASPAAGTRVSVWLEPPPPPAGGRKRPRALALCTLVGGACASAKMDVTLRGPAAVRATGAGAVALHGVHFGGGGGGGAAAAAAAPPAAAAEPARARAPKRARGAAAAAAAAPAAAAPPTPPAGAAAYLPCARWSGAKSGYVFKRGLSGVGYYRDTAPRVAPAAAARGAAAGAKGKGEVAAKGGAGGGGRVLKGGVRAVELAPGSGAEARRGRTVTVKYVGRLSRAGPRAPPFDQGTIAFRLGGGEVIPGWDVGLEGLRARGRRRLEIPSAMAYGKRGAPPAIPPNAELTFEVELLRVA